jgi:hypothetical protein
MKEEMAHKIGAINVGALTTHRTFGGDYDDYHLLGDDTVWLL